MKYDMKYFFPRVDARARLTQEVFGANFQCGNTSAAAALFSKAKERFQSTALPMKYDTKYFLPER